MDTNYSKTSRLLISIPHVFMLIGLFAILEFSSLMALANYPYSELFEGSSLPVSWAVITGFSLIIAIITVRDKHIGKDGHFWLSLKEITIITICIVSVYLFSYMSAIAGHEDNDELEAILNVLSALVKYGAIFIVCIIWKNNGVKLVERIQEGSISEGRSSMYQVVLNNCGQNKLLVIKFIKEELGLDLRRAKELADYTPSKLLETSEQSEADAFLYALKETGADAIIMNPAGAKVENKSTGANSVNQEASSASPGQDILAKEDQLKNLFDSGILTQEEYEKELQKLKK